MSLVIPRCNWPEDHKFVAYCQSEREIEYCSLIDVEELSISTICEISWHLEKGQPVVDDLANSRMNAFFKDELLAVGERPTHDRKPIPIESNNTSFWSKFISCLYDEKSSRTTERHPF